MKAAQRDTGPDTRERILDAAGDLFCLEGYSGASISRIAKSAGVLPGSLYWVFESKEHLFAEVLRSESEKWKEKLTGEPVFPLKDFSEFPRTFESPAREIARSPRLYQLILVVASEKSASTKETLKVVREVRAFWRSRLEEEIARHLVGVKPSDVKRFTKRISRLMTQMIDGAFVFFQVDKDEASIKEMLFDVGEVISREVFLGIEQLEAKSAKKK